MVRMLMDALCSHIAVPCVFATESTLLSQLHENQMSKAEKGHLVLGEFALNNKYSV